MNPFKFLLFASSLPLWIYGATQSVTNTADTATPGTLRYAMLNAASGDTIDCTGIAGQTITLTLPLPTIVQSNLTITVATGNPVTIDGTMANHFQAFSVANGTINIQKFNIINAGSQGGEGGGGAAGGGGGAAGGGGLYVHNGANVTIDTISFSQNEAVGGDGGGGVSSGLGGGGGGFGNNSATLMSNVNAGGFNLAGGGGGGNPGGGNGGDNAVGTSALTPFYAGAGGGTYGISGQNGGSSTPFGQSINLGGTGSANEGGGGAGAGGAGGNGTVAGGTGGNGIGVDNFFGGGGGGGSSDANGGSGFGSGGGGGGVVNGGAGGMNGGGGGGGADAGGLGGVGGGGGGGTVGGTSIFGGGQGGNQFGEFGGGGGAALGGAIHILNGGILTIGDSCSFTGNTVTGGAAGSAGGATAGVALSPDIFLRSGGALNFNFLTTNLTISTVIASDQEAGGGTGGGISLSGSKTLTLTAANTYSGTVTIQGGVLSVAGDTSLGIAANPIVIGTGTLQAGTGALNSSRAISLTGSATIDTQSFASSLSGTISGSGSLTKIGTASLTLTAGNTYSSGTTINAGTLIIGADSALGAASGPLAIGAAILQTTAGITSSRAISLTGAATINLGTFIDTLSGSISGTGSLTIAGAAPGTLNLTGTNSYTGGTTVNAGLSLQGNSSSLQGNIANSGSVIFNQTATGTYSGVLTGGGSLAQTGAGTLIVSGSSPAFTGPTSVSNGTLTVNGSLAGSPVTVGAAGTLGGTGTVGALSSSGQLIPGSGSSGTLTVNGNLSLTGTPTMTIGVAPESNTSLNVLGTASLTGAVSVVPASGFYGVEASYTILNSTSLLGTTFSSVSSTDPNFIPSLSYTPTSVILSLQITQPFLFFPFSNPNTQSVAQNINALSLGNAIDPALRDILDSLAGQSFATINDALDQMHPAQFSAFAELQMALGGQLISLFHRKPYLPCNCDGCGNPYRIWVEPFGNGLEEARRGFQIGFTSNSGGIAFGIDAQFRDNWTFGIGGAWNDTHIHWHHGRGRATINGYYGAAYTDLQKENVYLGLSLFAGCDFYDATRHIEFVTTNLDAKSDFSALDVVGQFSWAYFFGSPLAHVYPYANVDLMYLRTEGFSESGAPGLNLDVDPVRNTTVRSEVGVGLQVQDINGDETMCISPLVNFGWVMLCPLDRNRYQAVFEGESIPFSVIGRKNTWQLLSLDFGLSFSYQCFSLGLEYNVLSSVNPDKGGFFDQNGSVHLQLKW